MAKLLYHPGAMILKNVLKIAKKQQSSAVQGDAPIYPKQMKRRPLYPNVHKTLLKTYRNINHIGITAAVYHYLTEVDL
jgi:hypothetical protein